MQESVVKFLTEGLEEVISISSYDKSTQNM